MASKRTKKTEKLAAHEKIAIKIGTWNVRGSKGKEVEIVEEMIKADIDYLGITETKRKGKGLERIHRGYWLYAVGVEQGVHAQAGVGFIVREDRINNITEVKYKNERVMKINMKLGKQPITILVVYGPNEDEDVETKNKFYEELQEEVDNAMYEIIIMGDLNGRVGKNNRGIEEYLGKHGEQVQNTNGKRILELCQTNDLVVANTKFTHDNKYKFTREDHSRGIKSIIDYFLIQRGLWRAVKDVRVKPEMEIGSDHYLLILEWKMQHEECKEEQKKAVQTRINNHKLRKQEVHDKYKEILETKITQGIRVEERWESFKKNTIDAAKEACGTSKISNKYVKKTPWWTEDIKQMVKEKKIKWGKYLQTRNPDDYNEYKRIRTTVKESIKAAKENSWIKFGNTMKNAYSENQKLFYGVIKQMRQKKEVLIKNIKDEQGRVLNEEQEIMERWRGYFMTLLNGEEIKQDETSENKTNNQETARSETIINVTREEFDKAVRKMKLGKSAGQDMITPEMIKQAGEKTKEELLKIINMCIKERRTPRDWQTGIIAPIHKKGDVRECGNFRGISLLSIPGKIYARVIEQRIRERIEGKLEEVQCGFRKGRSTQDLIFTLRQINEKAIATNKQVHICYIDLEKAFDKVEREDVWRCLEKRGVEKDLIHAIKALYHCCRSYVRCNNQESEMFETKTGLRQGCVLSPLLFAVVLDEVFKQCKKTTRPLTIGHWKMQKIQITELAFADDMAILGASERDLQHNVNVYATELRKKGMIINKEKSKTMVISTKQVKHSIKIGDTKLEQVEKYKYLGVIMQEDGKIDSEIEQRIGATGRLYNAIRKTFLEKKEIPKQTKVEIYKKVAVPVLTYSSESWTTTEKHQSRLTSMEMRFLRKIENKTKLDRIKNEVHRQNLKIKPIKHKIQQNQLRWLGHVMRMETNRLPKRAYEARIEKRRVGRPRKEWQEEVREAVQSRGVIWSEVTQLAGDRQGWREIWSREPETI